MKFFRWYIEKRVDSLAHLSIVNDILGCRLETTQARNKLEGPGGAKSFWEVPNFLIVITQGQILCYTV